MVSLSSPLDFVNKTLAAMTPIKAAHPPETPVTIAIDPMIEGKRGPTR